MLCDDIEKINYVKMTDMFFSDFESKLEKFSVHVPNPNGSIIKIVDTNYNVRLVCLDDDCKPLWAVNEKLFSPEFVELVNTYLPFLEEYIKWKYNK